MRAIRKMMLRTPISILCCLAVSAGGLMKAENVYGTIIVKKQLTKRRVTPSLPLYQRGRAVQLTPDTQTDTLAFERSRVIIYLEGRHNSPAGTAVLEQSNRRFTQDTVVIPAGSRVSFPNNDPIFHNVFSLSKAKNFDLGNYPKGDTRTVVFQEPGIVYVNCHLHPNMTAAIVVTPNQWNARATEDGKFTLHDVPPGDYVAVAWHKAAGFLRKELKIVPQQEAHLEFLVPLDDTSEPKELTSQDNRRSR